MHTIAYSYNAACHCTDCAQSKFDEDLEWAVDSEGNEVWPISNICTEFDDTGLWCDTCKECIFEPYQELEV